MSRVFMLFFFMAFAKMGFSQVDSLLQYRGNWEGELSITDKQIAVPVNLEIVRNDLYEFRVGNTLKMGKLDRSLSIELELDGGVKCQATIKDGEVRVFIQAGILMHHLVLSPTSSTMYEGFWYPFMVDAFEDKRFFLSVEGESEDQLAWYPFFGEQRFTGTWAAGFQFDGKAINFFDFKTGIQFQVIPRKKALEVTSNFAGLELFKTQLQRSTEDWVFNKRVGELTSFMPMSPLDKKTIQELRDSISSGHFVNTHSILISRKGRKIFEDYYEGYHNNLVHDQRSASKSIAGTIIGVAQQKGLLTEKTRLYDGIPAGYQYTKNKEKEQITLKDLLTMSSGLDAVDGGVSWNSVASEDAYQSSPDWLKTVLEAPMIQEPGDSLYYGSANPYLLGMFLDTQLEQPVETYLDDQLFKPLGIDNYIIQTDQTQQRPYFGGGIYLTPPDMLKYGQLYLQKGKWEDQQLLSEEWVAASFTKYGPLLNVRDKNQYGYLWWHHSYTVGNQEIESWEARGAGGQYICVMPELDVVMVITSGNYRNGRTNQPETIIEDYLLPALLD